MSTTEFIIADLKARGYRITPARKHLLFLFGDHCGPLSAQEAHRRLARQGLKVSPVTVYRELAFFAARRILRPVHFRDGTRRYELAALPHHHHLVCLKCRHVDEFAMERDLDVIEKHIRKRRRFTVLQHTLEFYGLCSRCA